jgi:hypothetical protein
LPADPDEGGVRSLFGLDRKYAKFPNLLIAYVWHLSGAATAATFALSYEEALGVAEQMAWTTKRAWPTVAT